MGKVALGLGWVWHGLGSKFGSVLEAGGWVGDSPWSSHFPGGSTLKRPSKINHDETNLFVPSRICPKY